MHDILEIELLSEDKPSSLIFHPLFPHLSDTDIGEVKQYYTVCFQIFLSTFHGKTRQIGSLQ